MSAAKRTASPAFGEDEIVALIRRLTGPPPKRLLTGIGDDAVVHGDHDLVAVTGRRVGPPLFESLEA